MAGRATVSHSFYCLNGKKRLQENQPVSGSARWSFSSQYSIVPRQKAALPAMESDCEYTGSLD
jgi:hypothetical protein